MFRQAVKDEVGVLEAKDVYRFEVVEDALCALTSPSFSIQADL